MKQITTGKIFKKNLKIFNSIGFKEKEFSPPLDVQILFQKGYLKNMVKFKWLS